MYRHYDTERVTQAAAEYHRNRRSCSAVDSFGAYCRGYLTCIHTYLSYTEKQVCVESSAGLVLVLPGHNTAPARDHRNKPELIDESQCLCQPIGCNLSLIAEEMPQVLLTFAPMEV